MGLLVKDMSVEASTPEEIERAVVIELERRRLRREERGDQVRRCRHQPFG